jgi:hypothetical protein
VTDVDAPALVDLRQLARRRKPHGGPRPAALLTGARGLYDAGATIREVAGALGVSKTTAHHILTDAGTRFRRGRPLRKGKAHGPMHQGGEGVRRMTTANAEP